MFQSNDLIQRIVSAKFEDNSSIDHLLSSYYRHSPYHQQDKPFLQHLSWKQLKTRSVDNDLQWKSIVNRIIENIENFHCGPLFHKLLLNLFNLHNCLSNDELFKLINSNQFWQSFHTICNDNHHCCCDSLKLIQKLIPILIDNDNTDCDNLIQQLIESFRNQTMSRCIVEQWLRLSSILISEKKFPKASYYLKQRIFDYTILNDYLCYFQNGKDFTGNIWNPTIVSSNNSSIEIQYDCILIRSYLILLLKSFNSNEYDLFVQHLTNLISKLDKQKVDDHFQWLIEVFLSEDSELFEMLYLTVMFDQTSNNFIIHQLFHKFIKSISYDPSVLLDMLCTDDETATIFLRFLLVYLKISFDSHQDTQIVLLNQIKEVLTKLRNKINKLDQQRLFPYNPKPLLKLLYFDQ